MSASNTRAPAAGPRPAQPRRALALVATLVLVAAIVAGTHEPVLRAQALSFDDAAFVTDNPLVTHPGWSSVRRFFGEVLRPSTVRGYYLPLSMTSLMLDCAMGGRVGDLRAFHRTSLALHVLNTILIVVVLRLIFGGLPAAAVAGLLFGLHPLTVEPVAWIGERKTLLATFFALLSILTYVRYARGKGSAWLHASAGLQFLALLSKPTVIMLPLLLLVLDAWPLKRLSVRGLIEKIPHALLSVASGVITYLSHRNTAGIEAGGPAALLAWPLQACWLLAFYLTKIVWPSPLSCAYPPPSPFALSNPIVLASLAGVVSLVVGLCLVARRSPAPLAGWLFFVLAIAPTLGLVRYSWVLAADKYVYFPALGLLVLIAAGLGVLLEARFARDLGAKALLLAVMTAVLVAEGRGVRGALRPWTDSLSLFRHMTSVAPNSAKVQSQLGVILARAGASDEALDHLRRALELRPDFGEAHYNLGVVLAEHGRLEEGVRELQRSRELLPDDPDAAYNLGAALRLTGRFGESERAFRSALALKPDHVEAMDQLSDLLVIRGQPLEASDVLRGALRLHPDDPRLHFRLAAALLLAGGHVSEAVDHLNQAIREAPGWPEPANALAWLYATHPDPSIRNATEALRLASRAVDLSAGKRPELLDTKAAALAAAGRYTEAQQVARQAAELADRLGAGPLARDIRERLALYVRREPFVEGRPGRAPARSEPASGSRH